MLSFPRDAKMFLLFSSRSFLLQSIGVISITLMTHSANAETSCSTTGVPMRVQQSSSMTFALLSKSWIADSWLSPSRTRNESCLKSITILAYSYGFSGTPCRMISGYARSNHLRNCSLLKIVLVFVLNVWLFFWLGVSPGITYVRFRSVV